MKHYKDAQNNLFGFDDNISVPSDYIEISMQDVAEINAAKVAKPTADQVRLTRAGAFAAEADPLFFKYQAGEVTKEEWIAKREEIRARYPYPDREVTPSDALS
jgi:hypothetical protein